MASAVAGTRGLLAILAVLALAAAAAATSETPVSAAEEGPVTGPASKVPAGDVAIIVKQHNIARARYYSGKPVAWSPSLANYAQAWVNTLMPRICATVPKQWPNFGVHHRPASSPYGENIFFTFGFGKGGSTSQQIVLGWDYERMTYSYATNKCSPDPYSPQQTCDEFKQIVYKPVTLVGCGTATCPLSAPTGWTAKIFICNYDKKAGTGRPY
eukprot:SM000175S03317  [mRNA]  locus=s175:282648:284089:- [translate_table: standard]